MKKIIAFIIYISIIHTTIAQDVKIDLDTVQFLTFSKNFHDVPRIDFHNVYRNIAIGRNAGSSIAPSSVIGFGSNNTFMGYLSGQANTTGAFNTFIGSLAGRQNISGSSNISIGAGSAQFMTSGSGNVFLGNSSGSRFSSGSLNTMLGPSAGYFNQLGDNNVYIGYEAGAGTVVHSKSGNIRIGFRAGKGDTTDNKLYIENSNANASNALLYGDFDENILATKGQLGIGTIEPENDLHIYNSVDPSIRLESNGAGKRSFIQWGYNSGNGFNEWGGIGKYFGSKAIQINSNNAISLNVLTGQAIFIDTSMNVGIGTDAPVKKLDIRGGINVGGVFNVNRFTARVGVSVDTPKTKLHIRGANDPIIRMETIDSLNNIGIQFGFANSGDYQEIGRLGKYSGSNTLRLIARNELGLGAGQHQNSILIDENERIGIGTIAPDSKLHIKHSNVQNAAGLKIENEAGNWWRFYTRSGSNVLALYNNSAGLVGEFDNAGNYSSPSDFRRKRKISPMSYDLTDIMKLNAMRYQFNHQKEIDGKYHLGFIAQDVKKIIPELVNYNQVHDSYTINYGGFGVVAIQGIQAQQEEIDALQQKIKSLDEKLELLIKALTGSVNY